MLRWQPSAGWGPGELLTDTSIPNSIKQEAAASPTPKSMLPNEKTRPQGVEQPFSEVMLPKEPLGIDYV